MASRLGWTPGRVRGEARAMNPPLSPARGSSSARWAARLGLLTLLTCVGPMVFFGLWIPVRRAWARWTRPPLKEALVEATLEFSLRDSTLSFEAFSRRGEPPPDFSRCGGGDLGPGPPPDPGTIREHQQTVDLEGATASLDGERMGSSCD